MGDKQWERLAALGGAAFVVLNVVGTAVQGAPPSADDTNQEVLDWFVDKESGIKIAAWLAALSLVALAWWFGSLWRRMARAENGEHRLSVVALAGLAGGGALFAVSTAVLATSAIQVDEVGPDQAKFFLVLTNVLLGFAGAFIATFLAATNALALRTGFLPKWMGYLGAVSALLFLISTLATTTDADPVVGLGFLGFITWSIWLVATSVQLWRTADSVRPQAS